MRNYLFIVLVLIFILIKPQFVFAQSSYVLPYPAAMPGSFEYKLDTFKEKIYGFIYFGNISQFKFKLSMADKYLVEAKILFEYKQYLLGVEALLKSDNYFMSIKPNLLSLLRHNRNISNLQTTLKDASDKHVEILNELRNIVPGTFLWTPEKAKATNLDLDQAINNSIKIRKSAL